MKYVTACIVVFIVGFFSTILFSSIQLVPPPPSPSLQKSQSISFGDVSRQKTPGEIAAKEMRTREFLARLQAQTEESKRELAAFQSSIKRSPLGTTASSDPVPSPYIALPSLIAGIQSVTNTRPEAFTTHESSIGNLSINPQKSAIKIALLGDSMIDTLGKDIPHLKSRLNQAYPDSSFILLNYGYGSSDIEYGLTRLTTPYTYRGEYYPSLLSHKPDIVIVESFAYNHWSSSLSDLNRQWMTLAYIMDAINKESPDTKIILAATIAPDKYTYGDGVMNWTSERKQQETETTRAYLQNLIRFAASERYPLADTFTPSQDDQGNGKIEYIDATDHIHPSDAGKRLFADKIVETIQTHKIIQ